MAERHKLSEEEEAQLAEYRKAVAELSANDSHDHIDNSSLEHAAIIIEELFKKAKERVLIYTDHLNPYVYARDEVIAAAKAFMKKDGSKMVIIAELSNVDESILQRNDFIEQLKEYADRITVAKTTEVISYIDNHFMVVDTPKGHALRFELDTEKHEATSTFNAKQDDKGVSLGTKLIKLFDSAAAYCVEITPTVLWPDETISVPAEC